MAGLGSDTSIYQPQIAAGARSGQNTVGAYSRGQDREAKERLLKFRQDELKFRVDQAKLDESQFKLKYDLDVVQTDNLERSRKASMAFNKTKEAQDVREHIEGEMSRAKALQQQKAAYEFSIQKEDFDQSSARVSQYEKAISMMKGPDSADSRYALGLKMADELKMDEEGKESFAKALAAGGGPSQAIVTFGKDASAIMNNPALNDTQRRGQLAEAHSVAAALVPEDSWVIANTLKTQFAAHIDSLGKLKTSTATGDESTKMYGKSAIELARGKDQGADELSLIDKHATIRKHMHNVPSGSKKEIAAQDHMIERIDGIFEVIDTNPELLAGITGLIKNTYDRWTVHLFPNPNTDQEALRNEAEGLLTAIYDLSGAVVTEYELANVMPYVMPSLKNSPANFLAKLRGMRKRMAGKRDTFVNRLRGSGGVMGQKDISDFLDKKASDVKSLKQSKTKGKSILKQMNLHR